MVVKVYVSGISGNKEVKKRQQRVLMILDSKNIKYDVIDITEPGCEDVKDFMQNNAKSNGGTVSDPNPRSPLPPQIFNDEEYCGDYDLFDLANEVDTLEQFLKLEAPPEEPPQSDIIEESKLNGHKNSKESSQEPASETKEKSPVADGKDEATSEEQASKKESSPAKEKSVEKESSTEKETSPEKEASVEKDGSVEKEKSVEKEGSVGKEKAVEKEGSVGKEKSVEKEGSVGKEKSVEKEGSVGKEKSVEKEGSVGKEKSVEKEGSVGKEKSVEKERSVEKEKSVEKEVSAKKEASVERGVESQSKKSSKENTPDKTDDVNENGSVSSREPSQPKETGDITNKKANDPSSALIESEQAAAE